MIKALGPLEEIGGEWFVNRTEELDLFWDWATSIPERVKGSQALIGLRRTGKTAILHRLFNRLFHEQDRVLPVYISFSRYLKRTEPINADQFAEEYFTGLLRSYLAFRYRLPALIRERIEYDQLFKLTEQQADELALEWCRLYEGAKFRKDPYVRAHSLMQWVINFPKGYAWGHDLPMAMIIDEFQVLTKVLNPDDGRVMNLTDSFQEAAETHWAPLLVSGSSVSMMVDNALGGLLSGRFRSKHLGPLTQEYAYQMIFQLAQRNNITVTEELALTIWELTKGYPYPIECLLNSNSPDLQNLPAPEALQKVLLYELTRKDGALWGHYDEEYGKYIRELNGDGIARRILLWAVQQPPEARIYPNRVAEALSIPLDTAMALLQKLEHTDVIERFGGTYSGPADPMLRRYLEYEHYITIDQLEHEAAAKNLLREYNKLQGEMNRRIGHLAEIIVGGVMRSFDGRTVDGLGYFNTPGPVTLPKVTNLERRGGVIKEGVPKEIDLIAEWRTPNTLETLGESGVWLVSVRHRDQVMGEGEVRAFLEQTTAWLTAQQSEKPYDQITRWYMSKMGFTESAIQLLQAEGVYYSDLAQFNQLAALFNFLPLKDDKRKGRA